MSRLENDPTRFRQELIEGFVAANRRWVRAVPGGVVRTTRVAPGKVAVVIGGWLPYRFDPASSSAAKVQLIEDRDAARA